MKTKKELISCSYCKTLKPRNEFYKCKSRSTKLNPRCKICQNKADKLRRRGYTMHKKCLLKLGNKCNKCGFTDIRALQIDHVFGNGKQEKKAIKNQWNKFYKEVLKDNTGKYQCLCANCNWIKKSENKEGIN